MNPIFKDNLPPFRIPDLVVNPSRFQVFMFSAATWNRHAIHYSEDVARKEGHPDIVVQRGLLGNFLARQLTQWLGRSGDIRKLSWQVIQSAYHGNYLTCESTFIKTFQKDRKNFGMVSSRICDGMGREIAKGSAEFEIFD